MMVVKANSRRGSPLAVVAIVLVAWIGARSAMWENPFALIERGFPALLAENDTPKGAHPPASTAENRPELNWDRISTPLGSNANFARFTAAAGGQISYAQLPFAGRINGPVAPGINPRMAMGHQMLLAAAYGRSSLPMMAQTAAFPPGRFASPFLPDAPAKTRLDRWSLDTWAYWRQGSGAQAISQGRVPIYGGSQVGANMQFRLAPGSSRDPRLYTRAYRALVPNGETELAAGVSARMFPAIPLRAQAEVRLTDNPFGTEVRPAAFAVTELAPQRLPGGAVAEAYAQGGYVGGKQATAFADGQLVVSREVTQFQLSDNGTARVSVGAGIWGGAQKDAARLDLGPTVRMDLTIGQVPARLSLDWREQVAGDAAPGSGIAATLSTRF